VLVGVGRGEPMRISEILWQISDRFELAPSSIDLAAFEQQMAGVNERENCLSKVLDSVREDYDYVVIDCPPSVGLLTFNSLRAATDVVIPVEMGYFSLHGLSRQLETLSALCRQCEQKINVMVLASMYDIRTKMAREILAELKKNFAPQMFKTVVNFNTKLKEAASLGQPIGEYDPSCKGFKDFLSLADELVGTDTQVHRTAMVNTLQAKLGVISASADELLATLRPEKKAPEKAPAEPMSIDEKLAELYGVHQINGKVVFCTLYPRAKTVQIAGDFNRWNPEKATMQKVSETGKWKLQIPMDKGTYHYRLVVDGQWQQDPYNELAATNPFGEVNSILYVD
jgi:chromosome partitioning protein